jgi:glycosyltransferase involved in cell wall biosynthesis
MKILLFIDHLGLGGAQRQIVELACGLKRRGHDVEMFVYFPKYDFFRPLLREHQITLHEYAKGRGFSFGVLAKLVAIIRDRRFDAVISYLSSPNIYAELAVPLVRGPKLLISERVGSDDDKSPLLDSIRRAMHVVADKVVANSRTHSDWLRRKWWLRTKTTFIYNGLNLQIFSPEKSPLIRSDELRLIGIGRVGSQKNILGLVAALAALLAESGECPQINWAGEREDGEEGRRYSRQVDEALDALPEIRRRWNWLGVRSDIPELLRRHDALIHPSFYEGLPNAICEALAAGVPVLASNVCDHPLLVADGERGILFDPHSPESIAAAIGKFARLGLGDRLNFSVNARRYAEENLGVEKMVSSYECLLKELVEVA